MASKSGLTGTLRTMPLPDLLQWLAQGRKTGTLVLQHESLVKRLFLEDGNIVSCGSNDPREFLGQIMVSQQLISEAQLKEAFDIQGKTRVMLGRVLVQKGWVPEDVVIQALKRKTEETLYSLFLWAEGDFKFEEGEIPGEGAIPLRLKVEEVLLEGLRRYDLAQKIRAIFPTSAIVLARTGQAPPPDLLSNPFARKAMDLVDGTRTLKEICLELHAPEFTVSYFLLSALERGYVRVEDQGPAKPGPARAASADDHIRQTRELVRSGAFEEALDVLEKMGASGESSSEINELAKVAEMKLIDRLYRGPLPAKGTPFLERPLEALINEALTPEEVFLVSRINGSWDLKSIVSISPLREVDALRVLKRLKERGIISVKET